MNNPFARLSIMLLPVIFMGLSGCAVIPPLPNYGDSSEGLGLPAGANKTPPQLDGAARARLKSTPMVLVLSANTRKVIEYMQAIQKAVASAPLVIGREQSLTANDPKSVANDGAMLLNKHFKISGIENDFPAASAKAPFVVVLDVRHFHDAYGSMGRASYQADWHVQVSVFDKAGNATLVAEGNNVTRCVPGPGLDPCDIESRRKAFEQTSQSLTQRLR